MSKEISCVEARAIQLTSLASKTTALEQGSDTTDSVNEAVGRFPTGFEYRSELAWAATSRELKAAPRHNWFYFPHSYSYRLVNEILDYWDFPQNGTLADNFAGSGTTLLAARQRGLLALGFDLSPLAVTVAKAKVASYKTGQLNRAFDKILHTEKASSANSRAAVEGLYPRGLRELFKLLVPILELRNGTTRRFFQVALLWTAKLLAGPSQTGVGFVGKNGQTVVAKSVRHLKPGFPA